MATEVWPFGHKTSVLPGLGGLASEGDWRNGRLALGDDRVVPTMAVASARLTFFFNVADFPARRDFAIATDDAAATESSEAEKPDQTHDSSPTRD